MRDSGKASKSAIQSVMKSIDDYTAIIQNELKLILKETASLSDTWQDENFTRFMGCVERMNASVERELNTIDNARHELEKKVSMM